MHAVGLRGVLEHLRLAGGGLADGQLLTRFLDGHDEAAFAALVKRHGPMVLGVCRRVLGHAHDAEDAFQATFLVLARKAASVTRREAVASFLYGVAYRTALRARARRARRHATERQVAEMPHPEVRPPEAQDWRPVLDRELSLLPEKYRAALVLCDLECKSRREAARELGLAEGTLASRLARARRQLAGRLAKCGVTLSGGALAAALAEGAQAAVPAPWVGATARAAALLAAGRAGAAATPAALLMNEVLKAMLMTKLKIYVAAALVAVVLGAGGIAYRATGQTPQTGARPLTDTEILRREVEILKLQMEVLQAKVRAQEVELRALKGRPAAAEPQAKADSNAIRAYQDAVARYWSVRDFDKKHPDGLKQVEDALQALRQAKDNAARRRAVDALERALRTLREQLPRDGTPDPANPSGQFRNLYRGVLPQARDSSKGEPGQKPNP
jgi:RNA polymerase sigma factor (sigma-70 family)